MKESRNGRSIGALSRAVLGVILFLGLSACSAQVLDRGIPIRRSGVLSPGGPTVGTVYWKDDRQVLFIGAKPDVFAILPDGRRVLRSFLMQWDTASGEVTTLAELGEHGGFCYYHGYIRYWYRKPSSPEARGDTVFKAGLLGSEVEVAHTGSINRFSCREYDELEVKSKIGQGFWPLRETDGYWGAHQGSGRVETVLVRVEAGKRRETPLKIPYQPYFRWSEYAGSYVFRRLETQFSRTNTTGKMWLLRPDGVTTEFDIPAGPWFGGSAGYDITRRGVFMWSYALVKHGNGDAGGYLIEAGRSPKRFIEGLIYAYGISPNGCGIALSIGRGGASRESAEMVLVNVCGKGG